MPIVDYSSLGGRKKASESRAKAKALTALHKSRRGRRINGKPSRRRDTILAALHQAVLSPEPGRSRYGVAAYVGVSEKTIRRWLSGEDWPTEAALLKIQGWLKSIQRPLE